MINQWIDNRYEITRELMRSEDGIWYMANDTALKREIIILLTELNEYETLLKTQREMMNIGNMTSDAFLQILNAGRYEDYSFIIFQCNTGMPLFQYVERHAVSLQSVLQWVYRAGYLLQEGQRAGLPEFSVSFDNLWITHDHEILVMNYWKEARGNRTGVIGLMQLLYQCCTLHALAPRQLDIFADRMQSALKNEHPARKQSVITLVTSTFENEPSLNHYLVMLKEVLDERFVPLAEAKASMEQEQKVTSKPVFTMDTMMFTSDTAQELKAKMERERAVERDADPSEAGKGADIEHFMSNPVPSGRPRAARAEVPQTPAGKFSRKMKIAVITASCVLFFGLIGTAILWANSLRDNGSTDPQTETSQTMEEQSAGSVDTSLDDPVTSVHQDETSVPNRDESEEQANSSDGEQDDLVQEPDKELVTVPSDSNSSVDHEDPNHLNEEQQSQGPNTTGPTTVEGNDGVDGNTTTEGDVTETVTPGIVPNLIGLTQEEAEKQALAAGLKYSFKKENTEGTEAGIVFKQEPAAGTEFKKGDRITFYVARDNG